MLLSSLGLAAFTPPARGQPTPTATANDELPPPSAAPTPELDVPAPTPAPPITPSPAPITAAPPPMPAPDCYARACRSHGLCDARAGRCVAVDDAMCRRSAMCLSAGACTAMAGQCVARQPATMSMSYASKPRSEGAMWGGIVLCLSGVGLGLLSLPFWVDDDIVVGAAIITPTAAALIVIGVPMWVFGAAEIPTRDVTWLPRVQIGAGALDATWTF
jgi:hypothetical protein